MIPMLLYSAASLIVNVIFKWIGTLTSVSLVLFVLLGGGAAFYYFKFIKPKQNVKGSTDLEDFDFEDYDEDEPEADTGEVSKEEETEEEAL